MALTLLNATKKAEAGITYLIDGTYDQANELIALYPDEIAIQSYDSHVNGTAGYQEITLEDTSIEWGDDSGLSKYTKYHFKIRLDGDNLSRTYEIQLSSDTTIGAVIQAFNTVAVGYNLSIVSGVLTVTSKLRNENSAVLLSTPLGNPLFEAMTGFTTFATPIAGTNGDEGVYLVLSVVLPDNSVASAYKDYYIYISKDIDDNETIEFVMAKDEFEFLYTVETPT